MSLPFSHRSVCLGHLSAAVDAALAELARDETMARIWRRDPAVWPQGTESASDRLGWLEVPDVMRQRVDEIDALVREVRAAGILDVVLLGMGGSSLGAEVINVAHACPEPPRLTVLDSTVPAWVERVAREIDPARTLFLVASKSGTTAEVHSLSRYFWRRTQDAVGDAVGEHFVAITDPGSPLAARAAEHGYRRALLNPPDIGGRFSVLSLFGLVPAALAGVDLGRFLARATQAVELCRNPDPGANPGAWLGAVLGAAARLGHDKATLLTSPRLGAFGLWAEQLVAESTGKHGVGILPIADEPFAGPESYGEDRIFVALRLSGDANEALDAQLERLARGGHPTLRLELEDFEDLAAELYRWQMATAVVGRLLGVMPFDQPDVESTKKATRALLAKVKEGGSLPEPDAGTDLGTALADETPTYVALMAYTDASAELERAVTGLRSRLLARRLPSTFGYAPRMLHSTGQFHKGGPAGGLFVQLLDSATGDGPAIPGESYGLGTLARAQAAGDAEALLAAGRRVVRLRLEGEPSRAVDAITGTIAQACPA